MRLDVLPLNVVMKNLLDIAGVVDVSFMHFRVNRRGDLVQYNRRKGKHNFIPNVKGGRTVCFLKTIDGEIFSGIADCSKHDNFVYKVGREIAFERAVQELKE